MVPRLFQAVANCGASSTARSRRRVASRTLWRDSSLRLLVFTYGLIGDGELPGADRIPPAHGIAIDEVRFLEVNGKGYALPRVGAGGADFDGLARLALGRDEDRDGITAGRQFAEREAAGIVAERGGGEGAGNAENGHGCCGGRIEPGSQVVSLRGGFAG